MTMPTSPLSPLLLQMRDGGVNGCSKRSGRVYWAAMTKMGPNNAPGCVVWAISMLIIFYFVLYILTAYILFYLGIMEVGVCSDNKTGPNDTSRHVVWAISKFF